MKHIPFRLPGVLTKSCLITKTSLTSPASLAVSNNINTIYKPNITKSIFHHRIIDDKTIEPNPTLSTKPNYAINHNRKTSSIPSISSNKSIQPMDIDWGDYEEIIENKSERIKYVPNKFKPDKPISNIFMNHPHFNRNNPTYNKALNSYISENQLLSMNEPTSITIPTNIIEVPILSPEDPDNPQVVQAAADSQSDVEAIGFNKIIYYKNKGLIQEDRRGVIINTGNGPTTVKTYVPITVIAKNGTNHSHKFWCMESLPTYDFLLGRSLLHKLGWELTNRYDTWEHRPNNYDHIETELDPLPCTRYPWKGEPKLDVHNVKIDNTDLRPFLQYQLRQYSDVIAKHEWDSGKMLDIQPFSIDLI